MAQFLARTRFTAFSNCLLSLKHLMFELLALYRDMVAELPSSRLLFSSRFGHTLVYLYSVLQRQSYYIGKQPDLSQ